MRQKTILTAVFLGILILAFVFAIKAQKEELKLEILNGHSGGVLAVAVSGDGKFALTGSIDQTALLWDLETGKQLRRFVGHEDAVSAVQFSKDGKYVLTASYDKTARLWETATGKEIRRFTGHEDKILTSAISPDGKFVATAGEDKTARIWDSETGKQLLQINHAGRVNSIAFSPDSRLLLTGGKDRIARLFLTTNGKEEKRFIGHEVEINSVSYSPKLKQILTSDGKSIKLWDIDSQNKLKEINLYDPLKSTRAMFSQDGEDIIAGDNNGLLKFKIASGEMEELSSDRANVIATSFDGKYILFSDGSSVYFENDKVQTKIFDLERKKITRELIGKSSAVSDIAVSPEYNFLFTGNYRLNSTYRTHLESISDGTSAFWYLTYGRISEQFKNVKNYKSEQKSNLYNEKSLKPALSESSKRLPTKAGIVSDEKCLSGLIFLEELE